MLLMNDRLDCITSQLLIIERYIIKLVHYSKCDYITLRKAKRIVELCCCYMDFLTAFSAGGTRLASCPKNIEYLHLT